VRASFEVSVNTTVSSTGTILAATGGGAGGGAGLPGAGGGGGVTVTVVFVVVTGAFFAGESDELSSPEAGGVAEAACEPAVCDESSDVDDDFVLVSDVETIVIADFEASDDEEDEVDAGVVVPLPLGVPLPPGFPAPLGVPPPPARVPPPPPPGGMMPGTTAAGFW